MRPPHTAITQRPTVCTTGCGRAPFARPKLSPNANRANSSYPVAAAYYLHTPFIRYQWQLNLITTLCTDYIVGLRLVQFVIYPTTLGGHNFGLGTIFRTHFVCSQKNASFHFKSFSNEKINVTFYMHFFVLY